MQPANAVDTAEAVTKHSSLLRPKRSCRKKQCSTIATATCQSIEELLRCGCLLNTRYRASVLEPHSIECANT
jgi:hypothetical protein